MSNDGPSSFEVSRQMHASPGSNVGNSNALTASGSKMDPLPVADASLGLPFGGKPHLLEEASINIIFDFASHNALSASITDQITGVINQNLTQEAKGEQLSISEVSGVKNYSPGKLVSDLDNVDINKNTGIASYKGAEQ